MISLLLYHGLHKTFADFENVYRYRLDWSDGIIIETDKELEKGQVIIIKDVNEYAILVDDIWEGTNGEMIFSYRTAEDVIVRARFPGELRSL